jgi:probable HAF family extracellular repeat protein
LGGTSSDGYGINNFGQVTGTAMTAGGDDHAFLYSNGVMQDLGTLGGTSSDGYGINNFGQVTGTAMTAGGDDLAFLYSDGVMLDLNSLIDPSSPLAHYVQLLGGRAINDSGWIVANGVDLLTGNTHAYLLSRSPGVVTLLSSSSEPEMGASFTLTWNVPSASSCSASGGGANGSQWTGPLAINGTAMQTASVAGTFIYTLTCIVSGESLQSSVALTVLNLTPTPDPPLPPPPSQNDGSSGGGGGAIQWWEIIGILLLARLARRERSWRRSPVNTDLRARE